jgi:hypothetical protein
MSIVLPHSEEFSFEGVSVDTYFTFRLTTTGTCGFSRKTSKFYLAMLDKGTIDEDTESSRRNSGVIALDQHEQMQIL